MTIKKKGQTREATPATRMPLNLSQKATFYGQICRPLKPRVLHTPRLAELTSCSERSVKFYALANATKSLIDGKG
jgi:hypothetical protein